jgi:hypothetical protein
LERNMCKWCWWLIVIVALGCEPPTHTVVETKAPEPTPTTRFQWTPDVTFSTPQGSLDTFIGVDQKTGREYLALIGYHATAVLPLKDDR